MCLAYPPHAAARGNMMTRDAARCQITLDTCQFYYLHLFWTKNVQLIFRQQALGKTDELSLRKREY